MTKILTRGGSEWEPSFARGAVSALIAFRFGVRLDGSPITKAELWDENPDSKVVEGGNMPYDLIERYKRAIPAVKIENGIVTFNPIITL